MTGVTRGEVIALCGVGVVGTRVVPATRPVLVPGSSFLNAVFSISYYALGDDYYDSTQWRT